MTCGWTRPDSHAVHEPSRTGRTSTARRLAHKNLRVGKWMEMDVKDAPQISFSGAVKTVKKQSHHQNADHEIIKGDDFSNNWILMITTGI